MKIFTRDWALIQTWRLIEPYALNQSFAVFDNILTPVKPTLLNYRKTNLITS